jgi:hypothetical protein
LRQGQKGAAKETTMSIDDYYQDIQHHYKILHYHYNDVAREYQKLAQEKLAEAGRCIKAACVLTALSACISCVCIIISYNERHNADQVRQNNEIQESAIPISANAIAILANNND